MRKVMIWTMVVTLALAIGACAPAQKEAAKPTGPAADVALKYVVGPAGTYKVTYDAWRTAKFEGPELSKEPKLKSGRTGTAIEIVVSQTITAVNPDGSANAIVAVKGFKYHSEATSEVTNDFDSAREADKDKGFAKLIGQSYTIKLMPDGKAEAVDAAAIRGAITEGQAKDLVAVLFSDKEIGKLHSVNALPPSPKQKVGSTWSVVEPSPKAMMDAKNFEKVYTLSSVKDGVATIQMKASPSSKPVAAGEMNTQGLMAGMFSKMMESTDKYTGKMVVAGGAVKNFDETLDALWVAVDPQAKPDAKEPDKITIGYLQKHDIEKLD